MSVPYSPIRQLLQWRAPARTALAAILGAIALSACDPAFQIYGTVKDATGAPIPSAKLALVCEGDDMGRETTSCPDGSVRYDRVGWYPNACLARIRATGFVTQELPIGDHCVRRHGTEACLVVHIDTRLQPQ